MEVTCSLKSHVISIDPPLSIINLKPACSAFSAKFKLPPYFKKCSQGFPLAIEEANLHTPIIQPLDFRSWKSLDVSNLSDVQISNLKQLKPVSKIPVNILKAEIGNLKRVHLTIKPWNGSLLGRIRIWDITIGNSVPMCVLQLW